MKYYFKVYVNGLGGARTRILLLVRLSQLSHTSSLYIYIYNRVIPSEIRKWFPLPYSIFMKISRFIIIQK